MLCSRMCLYRGDCGDMSFISSMGLPVGAEVAIIYGGVLASGQIPNEPHHLSEDAARLVTGERLAAEYVLA